MASNLLALASNLVAMASNLVTMASNLVVIVTGRTCSQANLFVASDFAKMEEVRSLGEERGAVLGFQETPLLLEFGVRAKRKNDEQLPSTVFAPSSEARGP